MTESEKLKQELSKYYTKGKLLIQTAIGQMPWLIQLVGDYEEMVTTTKGGFKVLLQAEGSTESEAINKMYQQLPKKEK